MLLQLLSALTDPEQQEHTVSYKYELNLSIAIQRLLCYDREHLFLMGNISSMHIQGSCHFFVPLTHLSLTLFALVNHSRMGNWLEDVSDKFYFGLPFTVVNFV
jgi:hypothetical protein